MLGLSLRDSILVGGFALQLLFLFYNIVKTNTIKTNDLHHVALDLTAIKVLLKEASTERKANSILIFNVGERLAKLEGRVDMCQEMHAKKK